MATGVAHLYTQPVCRTWRCADEQMILRDQYFSYSLLILFHIKKWKHLIVCPIPANVMWHVWSCHMTVETNKWVKTSQGTLINPNQEKRAEAAVGAGGAAPDGPSGRAGTGLNSCRITFRRPFSWNGNQAHFMFWFQSQNLEFKVRFWGKSQRFYNMRCTATNQQGAASALVNRFMKLVCRRQQNNLSLVWWLMPMLC